MKKTAQILTTLLLAAAANCAFAQDQEKPDKMVLEQKLGSVMSSTGGDYETANIGALLVENQSLMLSEGAKATVVYYYDNGDRKCVEEYAGPNTFVIDTSCRKVAYLRPSNGRSIGIIVGTAAVAAAILNSADKTPAGPVSAGAR